MKKNSRIYIAGHTGLVGSAILRKMESEGFNNIIKASSSNLDLRNQSDTNLFFADTKPEYVFNAAAKVGGIHANNVYRGEFIYDNLMMAANLVHAAHTHKVKKLLFLGSSCIYPKLAPQPLKEEYLLSGPLEYTNEPYAISKIAGIKLCQAYFEQYNDCFISVMPTNLYGKGDSYHPLNSHVLPALIRRFHEAKEQDLGSVTIWGTGTARREFLFADDLADACFFLMNNYSEPVPINIGTGEDITITALAELIKEITGFKGAIKYDHSKPDGTPRKLLDVSRLRKLGWKHAINLKVGIEMAYKDFTAKQEITA